MIWRAFQLLILCKFQACTYSFIWQFFFRHACKCETTIKFVKTITVLTTHPLEALRVTARFVFMVDSRCFWALTSQKSTTPLPFPIVRMLPWKETERMLLCPFRDVIFLTACKHKNNFSNIKYVVGQVHSIPELTSVLK